MDKKKTSGDDRARRPYEPPQIIDRGDVRDVTMGGSPGANDSGVGDPLEPPQQLGG